MRPMKTLRNFDCPCTYDICRDAWCTPTLCAVENQVVPGEKPLWMQVTSALEEARQKSWEEELQEIIYGRQNGDLTEFQTAEKLHESKSIPTEQVEAWLTILCPNTLCGVSLSSRPVG